MDGPHRRNPEHEYQQSPTWFIVVVSSKTFLIISIDRRVELFVVCCCRILSSGVLQTQMLSPLQHGWLRGEETITAFVRATCQHHHGDHSGVALRCVEADG
jgi:hypothetical protein